MSFNLLARINLNCTSIGRYEIKLVKLGFRLCLVKNVVLHDLKKLSTSRKE